MAKDRNGSMPEKDDIREEEVEEGRKRKAKSRERADTSDSESDDPKHSKHRRKKPLENSDAEEDRRRRKGDKEKGKSRKRRSRSRDSDSELENSEPDDDSDSGKSEYSESVSESESEEERRRRRKKKEKRRREKEKEEREKRRRRKEKEKKRRKKEKEEKRKKKLERGKKGAVTNSWGKYGIIRETDMWNKRPEFTAWLQEVKQVNLEHLPNWEEKQMFKQFMEDHNTATFSSKKYYNLDAYFKRKMEKEQTKGVKTVQTERVVFNDEEQRRLEMLQVREKQKEQEVEALKRSMQSGMAQAMKEQAQLREEMAYQYKLGNFEAAAAIQRRLDPDVAM